MSAVVADTHTAIWTLVEPDRLSTAARAAIEAAAQAGDPMHVASISVVELAYLVEKGRVPQAVFDRLLTELSRSDSGLEIMALDLPVAQTLHKIPRSVVPDRIIAATALYLGLPLVTRDARNRAANIATIW